MGSIYIAGNRIDPAAGYVASSNLRRILIPRSPVHQMQEWQTALAATDVFHQYGCGPIGAGIGGDMGGDGDAGMRPEGMILRQGLDPEDIQRRMADVSCIKRRQQRRVINQRATTGV